MWIRNGVTYWYHSSYRWTIMLFWSVIPFPFAWNVGMQNGHRVSPESSVVSCLSPRKYRLSPCRHVSEQWFISNLAFKLSDKTICMVAEKHFYRSVNFVSHRKLTIILRLKTTLVATIDWALQNITIIERKQKHISDKTESNTLTSLLSLFKTAYMILLPLKYFKHSKL